MSRYRRLLLFVLASSAGFDAAAGCHQFQLCRDRDCAAHAGASSSLGEGGARGGEGASGAAGYDSSAGLGGANAVTDTSRAGVGGREAHAAGDGSDAGATLDVPQGGNGDTAGDADAGGAEAGGPPACVAPMADCNEYPLDGCETDLLRDVRHCGGCGQRCVGACIDGKCNAFEELVSGEELPRSGGITATATEVHALGIWPDNSLFRWSGGAGAATLFTSTVDGFAEVVGGVDRLYLLGNGELSSIPRSGGVVTSEHGTARCAVVMGPKLYAVGADGIPYFRDYAGATGDALPLAAPVSEGDRVWMAENGTLVVLVTEEVVDGDVAYSVYSLASELDAAQPTWVPLATGAGSPAQVRVGDHGIYIDVVLVDDGHPAYLFDAELDHELRETAFDGTTRVITASKGVFDFELVDRRLYLSVELPNEHSLLRIVPLDEPRSAFDVQTSSTLASLTYSEGFFYFGTTSMWFARLPGWLE